MCSPMPDFSDDELNDVPPVCWRHPLCENFPVDSTWFRLTTEGFVPFMTEGTLCNWPACEDPAKMLQ